MPSGFISATSAHVLHAWRIDGTRPKTALFVEIPFSFCTEQLDITHAGLPASFYQHIQDFAADAAALIFGQHDQLVDHSMQDAIADYPAKAYQALSVVGAQHTPACPQGL